MSGLTLLAALKAFDATARLGSMTAAAKLLGLQQPTVSAHVLRLEQEYGVELFYRRGRRLELTSLGRTLLELTRRAFSGEDDALALLAAAKNRYQGHLSVHAIGPYNVVPILRRFLRQHPHVRIAVGVGDTRTITHKIVDYQGDVGVVLNRVDHPELHCMPYRRQALVVFARKDHPLAARRHLKLDDLAGHPFVIREEGSTTRRVFEQALHARGVQVPVSLEMGSREAVREAVAEGLGLGVVAETAYMPDERLVKLPLTDDGTDTPSDMATHVHVICRHERRQVPLIAEFFKIATDLREQHEPGVQNAHP